MNRIKSEVSWTSLNLFASIMTTLYHEVTLFNLYFKIKLFWNKTMAISFGRRKKDNFKTSVSKFKLWEENQANSPDLFQFNT